MLVLKKEKVNDCTKKSKCLDSKKKKVNACTQKRKKKFNDIVN